MEKTQADLTPSFAQTQATLITDDEYLLLLRTAAHVVPCDIDNKGNGNMDDDEVARMYKSGKELAEKHKTAFVVLIFIK